MSNEVLLSDNDESSSSDSDISLPDLTKLQPYEFEPFLHHIPKRLAQ